jgi:dihydroorotase
MSLLVKNGRVFTGARLVDADVLCEEGKITKIAKNIPLADENLDAHGKLVLPGVIDAHVHFREPGMRDKEDWVTGSRSAVKGGVTTVMDMPNTFPPTTTRALLEQKRRLVKKKSLANYGFYFGATKQNAGEITRVKNVPGVKVYTASTTGNLLVDDEESIETVFKAVKQGGHLAFCHAEDEESIKTAVKKEKKKNSRDALVHCRARPAESAVKGVQTVCRLARKVGNRLHVTHTTTASEVQATKQCRATCDTTTSYLFLEEKHLKEIGNYAKMNPPVRSHAERMNLWKQLKTGLVDMVVSDHAPHPRQEKEKNYWQSPAGVPGVQTLVPLLLNEVNRKNLSLAGFVRLVSENPVRITRAVNKGFVSPGMDADLTVIDLKKQRRLTDDEIESKCGWTPFAGRKLTGWPFATIVQGRIAFHDGSFGDAKGIEVEFKRTNPPFPVGTNS